MRRVIALGREWAADRGWATEVGSESRGMEGMEGMSDTGGG